MDAIPISALGLQCPRLTNLGIDQKTAVLQHRVPLDSGYLDQVFTLGFCPSCRPDISEGSYSCAATKVGCTWGLGSFPCPCDSD